MSNSSKSLFNPHYCSELFWIVVALTGAHFFALTAFHMFRSFDSSGFHHNYVNLVILALGAAAYFCGQRNIWNDSRVSFSLSLLAFALITAVQWIALFLHHVAEALIALHLPHESPLSVLAAFAWGLVLLFGFQRFKDRAPEAFRTHTDLPAEPREGLILFLSKLNVEPAVFKSTINSISTSLTDPQSWSSLGTCNWRMPIQIIGYHLRPVAGRPPLRRVQVVCSEDFVKADGVVVPGTAASFPLLSDAINKLAEKGHIQPPQLVPYSVDFSSPQQLRDTIARARQDLLNDGIQAWMIDITSGTALCSAVAAATTLDSNIRYQYLDTNEPDNLKRIREYNHEFREVNPIG